MKIAFRILVLLVVAGFFFLEVRQKETMSFIEEKVLSRTRGADAGTADVEILDEGDLDLEAGSVSSGRDGDTYRDNNSGLSPVGPVSECVVERIIDGDTIHCPPVGRVRLIGMDTPERGQQPFGPAATEALTAMTPIGSLIDVEFDVDRTDRYDRILGYLWADGELVNWRLVREGWALIATYPPNVRYTDHFYQAQQDAREEGVGLWAVDGFACEPSMFRRGEC
jgi:micrococcal nuclease